MKNRFHNLYSFGLILFLATLACSSSTATPAPFDDGSTEPVAGETSPNDQAAPNQQQNIPGELPPETERMGYIGDQDSSITADQERAPGGDRFTFNRFERPFNTNTMDVYFPYLDILESSVYQDEAWVFFEIKLKGQSDQTTLPGRYAVELDLNLDGGGDWLVLVDAPSKVEWSVDGVQVWQDENDDVGGTDTMLTDDPAVSGDGYETKVFDQGSGSDADAAWARISPIDSLIVQFALKRALIAEDTAFLANTWAGTEDLDPSRFDFSDGFTHEQAGTSLKELEFFYPIKELSEVDNACRMPIGFQPSGSEPGLCPIAPPEQQDKVACPSGQYYCPVTAAFTVCYCVPE